METARLERWSLPPAQHLVGSHHPLAGQADYEAILRHVQYVVNSYYGGITQVRHEQWERFNVMVQELLDGTSVCVHFTKGDDHPLPVIAAGRGTGYQEGMDEFTEWVYAHQDDLYSVLGPNQYVLYGVWLGGRQHGVHYDRLPSPFIASDMFETLTGRFLTYDLMAERLGGKVHLVPVIWRSQLPPATPPSPVAEPTSHFEGLKRLLEKPQDAFRRHRSAFGQEPVAGFYVRIEYDAQVRSHDHRYVLKREAKSGEDGRGAKENIIISSSSE